MNVVYLMRMPYAVPAGTTDLRVATVQQQGDIVFITLAGQLSSAAQLIQVSQHTRCACCAATVCWLCSLSDDTLSAQSSGA